MRDTDRTAVYAAEDQLARLLERGGPVDFFGSTLTLPIERKFADIASVERYVALVIALPSVSAALPHLDMPQVRERRGIAKATYAEGVISLPMAGTADRRWAARELVVLHELAHHACWGSCDAAHGSGFRGALLHLVNVVIGVEAALILRAAFHGADLSVHEVMSV